MDRTFVSSSNLRSVGYDPVSSILEVEFRDGGVYQYFDVPSWRYEELLVAHSKGRYFDRFIKSDYSYRQIR